jgi:hypothetical protein
MMVRSWRRWARRTRSAIEVVAIAAIDLAFYPSGWGPIPISVERSRGSGRVDDRTVALQATKSLQPSCYRAAGSGVQLYMRRVEDDCCIALIF